MKYNKMIALAMAMFASAMESKNNLSKSEQLAFANSQLSKSHLKHVNFGASPMFFPTRSQKIKSKIRKRRQKCS